MSKAILCDRCGEAELENNAVKITICDEQKYFNKTRKGDVCQDCSDKLLQFLEPVGAAKKKGWDNQFS